MNEKRRILILDIETSPITSYTWGLHEQNVGLNQIKEDWVILGWAAKWLGDSPKKTVYMDNRAGDIYNDRHLVIALVALIEQADGIVTQNGKAFDMKKIRARALVHGLPPMRQPAHTDILTESRKVFGFTSHKLAYKTDLLNKKFKKTDHREYPGFELWSAILRGDQKAWKAMQKYCVYDVLSTEEQYLVVRAWIKDPADYGKEQCRHCGGRTFRSEGIRVTELQSYRRLVCRTCGKPHKGGV